MKKRFTSLLIGTIGIALVAIGVFVMWQKPEEKTVTKLEPSTTKTETENTIASSQPEPTPAQSNQTSSQPVSTPRSDTVPASPKQSEIRSNIDEEKTYYPLATPNDPGWPISNWPLTQMNAPTAWDISTGGGSAVVAVLDTGFALNHDDLDSSWHENSGEQGTTNSSDACWTGVPVDKSSNNCDDDGNGYIDDWRGWDFYNGTNNSMAGQDDVNGDAVAHGTETAGLVGAAGNNGIGIATLDWNTKVMPLKVLSDAGPGYTSDIVAAIYYAVDNGADVINLSLGGNEPDNALLSATNYAYSNGVVVIAAAGNCGTGAEDGCTSYPAGFIGYPARNPHVISVGATTSSGARASFSSYGDALDVMAPGSGSIYSPTWTPADGTQLYATSLYGTSFAAPYVSSLASLIKSIRPDTTPDDITAIILGTAQKTGVSNGLYSTTLGHGIVDAQKALTVASSLNSTVATPTLYQTGNYKSEHSYSANAAMASGCETDTPNSYCTVWLQNMSNGYDRILTYTLVNSYSSWNWNTSLLGNGDWTLKATQGEVSSADYVLLRK